MTTQSTMITLKFNEVNINEITCENVKMGFNSIPLLRYGSGKKTLNIQGPWIKMSQYGIPPGKVLSNGDENKFYTTEDSRLTIRFPIDERCCVQTDTDKTNSDEIKEFITFLKDLDNYIKLNTNFMKTAAIESDATYVSIYRKPVKSKQPSSNKEPKEKFYSLKTKLSTVYGDKKILTEFHEFDKETNKYKIVNSPENKQITLETLEETIKYNSEVLPIFQLVKIWTQTTATTNWGITLKLIKARIKKPLYSEKGVADFIESDEETEVFVKPKTSTNIATFSDGESDDDVIQVKKASQQINDDESDDDDDDNVKQPSTKKSIVDNESDDEPQQVVKSKTKIAQVPDSDSDEEVKTKKPVKVKKSNSKKSNA